MELPYLKTANSLFMWISCIPAVALVFFQAYIFMKRAWKTGPQMGVTKEQMKEAAKSFAGGLYRPLDCNCNRYGQPFGFRWRSPCMDAFGFYRIGYV